MPIYIYFSKKWRLHVDTLLTSRPPYEPFLSQQYILCMKLLKAMKSRRHFERKDKKPLNGKRISMSGEMTMNTNETTTKGIVYMS